jgi:hypothetical protein
MQNRTHGPCLAANNRILISHMTDGWTGSHKWLDRIDRPMSKVAASRHDRRGFLYKAMANRKVRGANRGAHPLAPVPARRAGECEQRGGQLAQHAANRMELVLFGSQDMTFGPYLAAIHRAEEHRQQRTLQSPAPSTAAPRPLHCRNSEATQSWSRPVDVSGKNVRQ